MVKRTYDKEKLISCILNDDYIECGIKNDFSDVDYYCLDKALNDLKIDFTKDDIFDEIKERLKEIRSKFFDYELNLYIEKILCATEIYNLMEKEKIIECKIYYLNDNKKTLKYPFTNVKNYLNIKEDEHVDISCDYEGYLIPYNSMYNLIENIYKVWILTDVNQYIIKNLKYSRVINEQLKEVIVNII